VAGRSSKGPIQDTHRAGGGSAVAAGILKYDNPMVVIATGEDIDDRWNIIFP